jgi:hypothetical protein
MILTEGLTELYTLQQKLDEEAHHDLQEYVVKSHQHIEEMVGSYRLTLTYGTITGGYEPIRQNLSPLNISKKKRSRTFHKKHITPSQKPLQSA